MAGFIRRFFSKMPISKSADVKELVTLACNLLTSQINLGDAMPGGANRQRLEMPYARGYLFGFVDALARMRGIAEEPRRLALSSVVHAKLFGKAMGSVFIADSQSSHSPDSVFIKGRAKGEADLKHWADDSGVPPVVLSDYLKSPSP